MNHARAIRERVGRPLLGRGRHSLTFDQGDGLKRLLQTAVPLHYSNAGELREIDTTWQQVGDDVRVADAGFSAVSSLNLQAPEVVRLERLGQPLTFTPLPLYYANVASDLLAPGTMQRLVRPQAVTASVSDDRLTWVSAYGPGTVLEWQALPTGISKWLTIDAAARLPTPLIPGPRALIVPFMVTMPGLRAALQGGLLDLSSLEVDESGLTLENAEGQPIFALQRPVAVDAAGGVLQGRLKFRRVGSALAIGAVFPLTWFAAPERKYPVRIDPTVTQETTDALNDVHVRTGSYSNTGTLNLGTLSSTSTDWQTGSRYPDMDVPKGAVIADAHEAVTPAGYTNAPTVPLVEILCEASDNAAQITSEADFFARARTAVGAEWTPDGTLNRQDTANFASALQAVVNRAGYARLAAINVFKRDKVRNNPTINRIGINSAAGATTGADLIVVYSDPQTGGGGSTGTVDEIRVTMRPRASADDGYVFATSTSIGVTATFLIVNDISSTQYDGTSYILMTLDAGQVLPRSVTLKEAWLYFTASGGAQSSHDSLVSLEPADNPTAPTTPDTLRSRAAAVAATATLDPVTPGVTFPWVVDSVHRVDVKAMLQAIVNRPGYNSGRVLAFWRSLTAGFGGDNNNHQAYTYNADPAKAVRLEVTFLDPNPPVIGGELRLI